MTDLCGMKKECRPSFNVDVNFTQTVTYILLVLSPQNEPEYTHL